MQVNIAQVKGYRNYFDDWTLFEKVWLATFTSLVLVLSYMWVDTPLGIFVSLSGMMTVVLVAKARISNYVWGIPNVIGYAYLAYGWQFYGEVMLNLLFFLPMQFIGWYQWTRPTYKKSDDEIYVRFLTNRGRTVVLVGSVALIIAYGVFLDYIGGNLPYFDSTSTVLSIIAMFLMVKAYMEQWVLWIMVNLASIYLWLFVLIEGGVEVTILLMWTAFLFNAIYGWYNWIKLYTGQRIF